MRKLRPFSFLISIERKCEGALLVLHRLERYEYFREGNSVHGTNCGMTFQYLLYAQARRQGGFEGVRSNPPFGSKRFYMHRLTVHFKCPTV